VVFVLLNHKFLSGVCVAQSLFFMWCLRCSMIEQRKHHLKTNDSATQTPLKN
jgi:hypothetical protein